MDGRKGFILSWNKEHREIHEEVLRHFLDPSKRGTKIEYKPKLSSRPETEKKEGCQQSKRDSFLDPSKRETKFEYKPERRLPPPPEPEKKERTQQSERDSFSEPSRTESAKLSSAMMKAVSDPLQQAEKDSSLGRTTSHISSPELRSSSSGAVRNVGVSSHKGTSSGLPETQRNSIGEIAVHLLFREIQDFFRLLNISTELIHLLETVKSIFNLGNVYFPSRNAFYSLSTKLTKNKTFRENVKTCGRQPNSYDLWRN